MAGRGLGVASGAALRLLMLSTVWVLRGSGECSMDTSWSLEWRDMALGSCYQVGGTCKSGWMGAAAG